MDILPVELHLCIFNLTCTDDGTARTLSAVSRSFHEVSKSFLYRNLSVIGSDRVLGLLRRLEALPPNLRQIHHLFLTDSDGITTSSKTPPPPPQLSQKESQAITRLITLAAPTLRSLSFVPSAPLSGTSLIARVFRTSFPVLQSLTISGFYPFPSSPGKFPSLKRLHLNGNRNPHGLFQMGALEDACPRLVELEVTGLGAASAFVLELEDALVGSEARKESDNCDAEFMLPGKLPPSVRRVTLQAGPEPVALVTSSGHPSDVVTMKDRAFMGRLQALKSVNVNGVDIFVRDRPSSPISAEDVQSAWLLDLCSVA